MLAIGAVALLLAVVGRVPLRWVIGGNEIDMTKDAAVAEVMSDALASAGSPESTRAVANQLANSKATRVSPTTVAMLEWVAFEQSAIARVTAAVTSRPRWTFTSASVDRGVDGTVWLPDGREVGVEFKLARNRSDFSGWFDRLQRRESIGPIVLVVSSIGSMSMASRSYLEELSGRNALEVVGLEDPDFDERFLAACDAVLGKAS